MKDFVVMELNRDGYGYLIIATSHDGPIRNLEDVETELAGYSGKILFDLTYINGTNSNRYLEADVSEGIIDRRTIKKSSNDFKPVNTLSSDFFMNNTDILEHASISNSKKYLLKTGQTI